MFCMKWLTSACGKTMSGISLKAVPWSLPPQAELQSSRVGVRDRCPRLVHSRVDQPLPLGAAGSHATGGSWSQVTNECRFSPTSRTPILTQCQCRHVLPADPTDFPHSFRPQASLSSALPLCHPHNLYSHELLLLLFPGQHSCCPCFPSL